MALRNRRLHAVSPREHLDRAVLLLAFLLGAGGGVFVKLTGFQPEWIAAVWSAMVLVIYAAAAWLLGQLRIEPETIGDNCYYLGFLFTLTGLAVTLYQLGGDAGGDVMRDIISGFGIALSSTIVGVFLRVLLMQIRPDIVARDREARVELHTAAREFRGALAASIAEIKAFATESVQLAAEQSERIRAASEATIELHRQELAGGADLYAEALKAALAAAADKAVSDIGAAVASGAGAALAEVRRATGALTDSLEAFRKQESQALALLADRARQLALEYARTQAALAQITERLAAHSRELEALTGRLGGSLEAATKGFEATTGRMAVRLGASLGEIEAAATTGVGVLKLEALAEALQKPLASLEATAKRMNAVLEGVAAAAPTERMPADPLIAVRAPEPAPRRSGWIPTLFGARPNPDLPTGS